jgi:hypothetical protein
VTRLQDEVKMVWHQGPCITGSARLLDNGSKAEEEIISVTVLSKDGAALYSPSDDVVNGTGRIYARLAWHASIIGNELRN